jgi:hypothetical protein
MPLSVLSSAVVEDAPRSGRVEWFNTISSGALVGTHKTRLDACLGSRFHTCIVLEVSLASQRLHRSTRWLEALATSPTMCPLEA